MKLAKQLVLLIVAVMLLTSIYIPQTSAVISYCSVNVEPHSVLTNTPINLQFTYTNTASETSRWIRIVIPVGYFTVSQVSAPGWSTNISSQDITLSGSSVAPGQTYNFTVSAEATEPFGSVAWNVLMSDVSNGSDAVYCDGDTTVASMAPQAPVVSNVQLSNLSAGSVTINWDTDVVSNSVINYGKTNELGIVKADPSYATSHSITLNNLSANTAYYYQLGSSSGEGLETLTDISTFLTPVFFESTPTPITPGAQSPSKITTNANLEKEPPKIVLSTQTPKPVSTVPQFKGTVSDNVATARVDFSTDGGKNWLPVDAAAGLGGKTAAFNFTPKLLEDGDYLIIVRATDTSSNQAFTATQLLVLDRLPPQVGGSVLTVGPHVVEKNDKNIIEAVVGVEYKFTTSSIGGATEIKLVASQGQEAAGKTFHLLTRNPDNGLWSGIVLFSRAGRYELTAESVDGAGNKTSRKLHTVVVSTPMRITGTDNTVIPNARAILYYRSDEQNRWEVWDARAYGQLNPQNVTRSGELGYFMPRGTYYLEVSAPGFKTAVSDIFTIDSTQSLNQQVTLPRLRQTKLFGKTITWPSVRPVTFMVNPHHEPVDSGRKAEGIINKPFPAFNLSDTGGQKLTALNLRGKYTIISVVSSWSPGTPEILPHIEELQANKDFRFIPVFIHERPEKVKNYLAIGGYDVPAIVDPEGQLVNSLQVGELPTHYIIDRHGIVKKVVVGVLSKEELLNTVVGF